MADQLEYRIKVKDDGSAKVRKFGGNVRRTSKDVKGMGTASGIAGKAVKGLVAAMAVKQVFSFAKSISETYDQQIKLGRAVGLSAKSISGFQFAAQLGGASAETMDKALLKLSKNMNDADKGIGLAKDAFESLGVEMRGQDGALRKTDDVILELSDKFAKLENGTEKAALAQELFGKSGAALINTLNGGSEALARQVKEGAELSGVTEKNAELMEQANDAMLRLKTGGTGAFASIVVSMKPWIDNLALASRLLSENIAHKKLMEDLTAKNGEAEVRLMATRIARLRQAQKLGVELKDTQQQWLNSAQKQLPVLIKKNKLTSEQVELIVLEANLRQRERIERENGIKLDNKRLEDRLKEIKETTDKAVKSVKTVSTTKTKASKKAKEETEANYDEVFAMLDKEEAENLATIERIARAEEEADEKDRQRFDLIMEFKANEEEKLRQQEIKYEEDRKKAQEEYLKSLQTGFGLAAQSAGRLSATMSNFTQAELNDVKATYDARRVAIEKTAADQMTAAVGNAQRQETIEAGLQSSLADLEEEKLQKESEARKKYASIQKALKMAEATANGAVAVTQAYAQFGFPAGLIPAGIITGLVASELALISSQRFAQGGEPMGKNAHVVMNESGQEAVLNAQAYKYVGREFVQSLNAGRGNEALGEIGGGSQTINVNLSGVIDKRAVQNVLLPALKEATRNKR